MIEAACGAECRPPRSWPQVVPRKWETRAPTRLQWLAGQFTEGGGHNHPAHPLRTTVRPSPSSWWDSTSSIRFSASGCREKRNAEAVRICRIRYQDMPSALLSGLYGPPSGYPRVVGVATLRGWMNE